MKRKLASIQTVTEIRPIKKADRIEVAVVMGWRCVVKKGEFVPGDKVIYCEVDSLLPEERPEFEFMKDRGFRVKTVKLRGQISQGLCFPISLLKDPDLPPGTDVTEHLGITQYVSYAVEVCENIIAALPGYVSKTSEPRIQSFPDLLEEMRGIPCYITTKIDGESGTFVHRNGDLHICSHTSAFKEDATDIRWIAANRYDVPQWLPSLGNFAIQGEIAGPGIRKNRLGLDRVDFFCFNVYDIDEGRFYNFEEFLHFCQKHGLQTVPVDIPHVEFQYDLTGLLKLAEGKYANGQYREGIVVRPVIEQLSEVLGGGDRMSFKVINNQFLLKED